MLVRIELPTRAGDKKTDYVQRLHYLIAIPIPSYNFNGEIYNPAFNMNNTFNKWGVGDATAAEAKLLNSVRSLYRC